MKADPRRLPRVDHIGKRVDAAQMVHVARETNAHLGGDLLDAHRLPRIVEQCADRANRARMPPVFGIGRSAHRDATIFEGDGALSGDHDVGGGVPAHVASLGGGGLDGASDRERHERRRHEFLVSDGERPALVRRAFDALDVDGAREARSLRLGIDDDRRLSIVHQSTERPHRFAELEAALLAGQNPEHASHCGR